MARVYLIKVYNRSSQPVLIYLVSWNTLQNIINIINNLPFEWIFGQIMSEIVDDEHNEKDGFLGRYRRYIFTNETLGVRALPAVEQINPL